MSQRLLGSHGEWVEVHKDHVAVGLTASAIAQMGDIEKLRVPETGTMLEKGDAAVTFESCKAAYDFEVPFAGKVSAVHKALLSTPFLLSGEEWMFTMTDVSASDLAAFANKCC